MRILHDYLGQAVRLTDERLEHILGHPEMRNLEAALIEVLSNPELVVRSTSDSRVVLNYRLLNDTVFGVKWMCVVVKHQEDDAFVLTVYLTDKPKKGTQLWPST